jgi:hypothetical protein
MRTISACIDSWPRCFSCIRWCSTLWHWLEIVTFRFHNSTQFYINIVFFFIVYNITKSLDSHSIEELAVEIFKQLWIQLQQFTYLNYKKKRQCYKQKCLVPILSQTEITIRNEQTEKTYLHFSSSVNLDISIFCKKMFI